MKRRLVFWRVVTVLALMFAGLLLTRGASWSDAGPHLARLPVSGLITENSRLIRAVDALASDDSVKGLILKIDSPGGSVVGGEALHDAIARVAAKKPVVAVMGATAASAAYMIAVPAQRIFAHQATLTGSIGVLMEAPEFSGLLDKLGVAAEVVRSGPLKDEPSLVRPMSPAGRAVAQGLVDDMYDQFVTMVAQGRNMSADQVRALGDGRPYTGRQALKLGLIDEIGGDRAARAWLAANQNIPTSLPEQDVSVEGLGGASLPWPIGGLLVDLGKILLSQSLSLDGAWAVWHRPGN